MRNLSSYAVIAVLTLAFLAFVSISDNFNFNKINAQTSCSPPAKLPTNQGFPKNSQVTVRINSNQFTSAQYDCLKAAFTNWNAANGSNGITFNVSYSPTAIVLADGSANTSITNPVQVNSGTPTNPNAGGNTSLLGPGGTSPTTAAYTIINPGTTNCTALTQTMAHEIGHMMGLNDCTSCAAGTSVMTGVPCTAGPPISCNLNDTTNGRTGPSTCDTTSANEHANNPSANPTATPPPGGDDGGGCRGTEDCGGGDDPPNCHTESYEECYYDDQCDEWDPYTGTCTVYPGYDYCYTVWYEVCN